VATLDMLPDIDVMDRQGHRDVGLRVCLAGRCPV
jgi:hypothetical protein